MALAILRTLNLTVSSLQVLFSDDLDPNIGIANILVTSNIDSVANPDILSVIIENNVLTVNFRPLFSNTQYKVTFVNTDTQFFQTINGDIITQDGTRNAIFITSPGEEVSPIRDAMLDAMPDTYEKDQPSTVRKIAESLSNEFQRASDTVDTVEAANYISIDIIDERITRNDGPVDRFANGGVFEVSRVATTPTNSNNVSGTLTFDQNRADKFKTSSDLLINSVISSTTLDPISLQEIDVINEQVSDNINVANFFQGLKIRVSNGPVLQVVSVLLIQDGNRIPYNIEHFGYTLNNNRYDTKSASTNVTLTDHEIELSSSSITGLAGGFSIPAPGDIIFISYIYKRAGRSVDSASVQLSTINTAVRELIPALLTSFNLAHAPVVTADDAIPTNAGVSFLNGQAINGNPPFSIPHPAFQREIKFDLGRLPSRPGEYSVNYNAGVVFVFGEDQTNNGTGTEPPVATYTYREIFIPNLDYTYNSETTELAINSTRNLAGIESKITFQYQDTFTKNIDYRELFHIEVLNERVQNRLLSDFQIQTVNSPVTNVFRIFNETTGEVYIPVRFNDTSITFNGRQAPRQKDIARERAQFLRVPQETILVSDQLTNTSSLRIIKANLQNNKISDSNSRFIGANFNTSVIFSRPDIFVREFFYENQLFTNITSNLNRLINIGDYLVDYTNGIIYVAVSDAQDSDLGDITYQCATIQSRNPHILAVNNIYRSVSALRANLKTYGVGDVEDTTVQILGLEQVGERFLGNDSARVLLVGSYQNGSDGVTTNGIALFTSNSAVFAITDIGRTIQVGSSDQSPVEQVTITGIINAHQVTTDIAFSSSSAVREWVVLDLSPGGTKTIALDNDIVSIKNIYNVEQLGTVSATDLDGYFDVNRDSVNGNIITLGASNPLQLGDAVIVDYNYGDVFIDYEYLQDEILISYEYGNNNLDWSISGALNVGDEYFVTYKYGALRDSLLANFGSLTQIPQLTNFSPNLDREVYRSIVAGALQSFVLGPTIPSIKNLVEAFTDVEPEITEFAFNTWILGRDYLNLRKIESNNETFDLGKFDAGINVINQDYIRVPAISHLKLAEGTLEAWVRPNWNGLANDSTLTFDLAMDGYKTTSDIYIGFSGQNPTSLPFTLTTDTTEFSIFSRPANITTDVGFFIWFDETTGKWNIICQQDTNEVHTFDGTITTSGYFYNVVSPTDSNNMSINESSDHIYTNGQQIKFHTIMDFHEGPGKNFFDGGLFTDSTVDSILDGGLFTDTVFLFIADGGLFTDNFIPLPDANPFSQDGIQFASGDTHYLFDVADSLKANRMSIFKDGSGFLNFHVVDNRSKIDGIVGQFNLATDVSNWKTGELHQIAAAWKFNSDYEKDEMHLFVDGVEAPNLFKYGGKPEVDAYQDYKFRNVGQEILIESATKSIVGSFDGSTTSGSNIFFSNSTDFTARGIQIGDQLYILEDSADGTSSPNNGASYTITGIGTATISVNRNFTQTIGNLNFAVNPITSVVMTPVNYQPFTVESGGIELNGLNATHPDYSVRRGQNNEHVLTINNGVSAEDRIVIKSLGLIYRNVKETVFVYGSSDTIKLLAPAPVTLEDVSIISIPFPNTLISTNLDNFRISSTMIGPDIYSLMEGTLDGYYSISNASSGRRLTINLSGGNIVYVDDLNTITINGTAYSGATSETLIFHENGNLTTTEYWQHVDNIDVSVAVLDTSKSAGTLEVREYKPITISENNGDAVVVSKYANGFFTLEVAGSGGMPFTIQNGYYEIEYPTYLRIRFDNLPDNFYIGSDSNTQNQFNGVIDEFRILDTMRTDTRIGETLSLGTTSITTDFNDINAFTADPNTLLLLHFDDNVSDSSIFYDRFNTGYEVAPSVNSNFGTAIKFEQDRPFVVSNAQSIFNNDSGTIEFWVNPLDDVDNDSNNHYFVDLASIIEEQTTSLTSINVLATQRILNVDSIRLVSDVFNTGTNYFSGGSVSNVDGRTITLGIPLPAQNTQVKIIYSPLNSNGDRVSIFRDSSGFINFYMKASQIEHLISVKVDWARHTWHRIMVMWTANSANNQDRLRLFVDGSERGTIKYGTGLLYGTGVIYGQAEVRPGQNRFLVDNIDLRDTFSRIFIGSDILGLHGARALIDNLRFSNIERLQSINIMGNDTIDANYVGNIQFALPVVTDDNTTALYDFDTLETEIQFLVNLINAQTGIFRFDVDVIDSFDKVIGNTQLENLLIQLINILKPAHTTAVITFTK